MRQVNIDKLKAILSREVKTLPFEITKRGKVIAIVISPNHSGSTITNPSTTVVQSKKQNKQDTNHIVQPEKQNKESILDSGKYDSNGKFITNFKK